MEEKNAIPIGTNAGALLVGLGDAGILQAFDVEVTADVADDFGGGDDAALDVGVAPALDDGGLAGSDVGVGPRCVVTVGMAAGAAGGEVEREAVLLTADGKADADGAAAGAVGAVLACGALRGLQP